MPSFATRINGPIAVIGDVHGQVEQLLTVLEKLRRLPDYEQRWIVFIGDLVDRGPDAKGALDVLVDLMMQHPRTTAIAGNHDFAMASSLKLVPTPEFSNWAERWTAHYDSDKTFASYGAEFPDVDDLRSRLPESHQLILADMPWCVDHPDYFFVHAGLDANAPFDLQRRILQQRDFTLTRPQWLCSKTFVNSEAPPDCNKIVVSGHVRVPQVTFRKQRLLIDTTGGVGGDLSCVLLPEHGVISSGDNSDVRMAADKSWWQIWKR